MAQERRGGPAVDEGGDCGREVGALVDDPADRLGGERSGREEPGAKGGVGAGAAEDVFLGWPGWGVLDFIL